MHPGIEIVVRQNDDKVYYFIFNSTDDVKQIQLKCAMKSVENDREISGCFEMKAREFCVLYRPLS
jgi:hypothetical protein